MVEPPVAGSRTPPEMAGSPIVNGFLCRCPRCAKGAMFAGFLTLADRCASCGLDFGFADTGDGPSFFASFVGGIIVVLVGVVTQVVWDSPWWVYVIILLIGSAFTIALIRPLKGVLVALQYANKAEQGHFE